MKKFRIIYGSGNYPYKIQKRKFLVLWKQMDMEQTMELAESTLRDLICNPRIPVGAVLKTYDESDLVVEKLKGK